MFTEIPAERPSTPLLDQVDSPEQLREFSPEQLPLLARELRSFMLYSVGQSGGHFGAGLGVVELTIALHYAFNTPSDRLLWDVGHQAYPHKILTGRREQMTKIRSAGGLAAFPRREESPYDAFGVGHSSTSISAALGMTEALKGSVDSSQVVAVIGDGAMTAGMAFEALNHAGHEDADLLVVFNDNEMSISENVGALSKYFGRLLSSKSYAFMREGSKKVLSNIPHAWEIARRTEEHVKGMVTPGTLFEEMGFNYVGPVDGHDVNGLVRTLKTLKEQKGPRFLHVITRKGKGFQPAEEDPIRYHALSPKPSDAKGPVTPKKPTYSNIFGHWLCDEAAQDTRLVGITPAMREGSDLVRFSEQFPERYYDVAIAEQHAVTFAAGLACEGKKPVVAIYSTFLQRAYDQLIHDVAIQNLDVTFAIDRAGLVGADGPTHAGAFDISFMRCIPNLVLMLPSDENQARQMLHTAYHHAGPAAVRYPRGTGPGVEPSKELQLLPLGKAEVLRRADAEASKAVAILSFGHLLQTAKEVAEALDATLVDMRFVKPLDTQLLNEMAQNHRLIVTLEDNAVQGGAGAAVAEHYCQQVGTMPSLMLCGLPDEFVEHGSQQEQYRSVGLDAESLVKKIQSRLTL